MSHFLFFKDLDSLLCFSLDFPIVYSCPFLLFPVVIQHQKRWLWKGRSGQDWEWGGQLRKDEKRKESLLSFFIPPFSPSKAQLVFKSLGFWIWRMLTAVTILQMGKLNEVRCTGYTPTRHSYSQASKLFGREQVCNALHIAPSPGLTQETSKNWPLSDQHTQVLRPRAHATLQTTKRVCNQKKKHFFPHFLFFIF